MPKRISGLTALILERIKSFFPTLHARALALKDTLETVQRSNPALRTDVPDEASIEDLLWSIVTTEFMISNRKDRIYVDDFSNLLILGRESGLKTDTTSSFYVPNNSNPNDTDYDAGHWGVTNGTALAAGYYQIHPSTFETILMRLGFPDYTALAKKYHAALPAEPWYIHVLLICVRNWFFFKKLSSNGVMDRNLTFSGRDNLALKNWFFSKMYFGYTPSFLTNNSWNSFISGWGKTISASVTARGDAAKTIFGITDLEDIVIYGPASTEFEKLSEVNVTHAASSIAHSYLAGRNRTKAGGDPMTLVNKLTTDRVTDGIVNMFYLNPPSFFEIGTGAQDDRRPDLPLFVKLKL